MTQPAIPSPAATLVLLRPGRPNAVETLLIERHARSRFAGGDYVFAGGKVDPGDAVGDVERFCQGLTGAEAAARLGGGLGPKEALGYWVGAIREAFEEVGILLAYGPEGDLVRFTPESHRRFAVHRAACQQAHGAFFNMLRAEGLTLATDHLGYFAHWITPEEQPLRFDTRFFAAPMPPGQEAQADGHEIVDLKWLTPAGALEAMRRKEISLRLPTVKNLELLSQWPTVDAALGGLAGREVPTIRPRVIKVDGKPFPVLPGDPRWY